MLVLQPVVVQDELAELAEESDVSTGAEPVVAEVELARKGPEPRGESSRKLSALRADVSELAGSPQEALLPIFGYHVQLVALGHFWALFAGNLQVLGENIRRANALVVAPFHQLTELRACRKRAHC